MKFLNQLTEREESKRMNGTAGFRLFNAIDVGSGIELSVQASYGHYCSPRMTVDLDLYKSMEIAILKDGEFVSVNEVVDSQDLIERFEKFYEGTVYGFAPVQAIEHLYEELITK